MSTSTLFYIILAIISALILALFQYTYRSKRNQLNLVLSTLRFITYLAILILIINPKFEKVTLFNEKPNLIVAIDNSESIKHLGQEENASNLLNTLQNDAALNNKFNVAYYSFGNGLNSLDSLSYNESISNINSVFSELEQVYKNTVAPLVLITDGNQTFGSDYLYSSNNLKQPIYPVILGDTVTFSDLKIQQLNVNKYAYLKNKFPVEIFISYSGNLPVNSQLVITTGSNRIYSEALSFSKSDNSKTINLTLDANSVGVTTYTASILPLSNEKNTVNNSKPFAVEVIDEKTNVAIVSTMIHPDIGALKKAIESNEQRSVSIVSPNDYMQNKENYQLVILYQPNSNFKSIFDDISATNSNAFIISGTETNWNFLNGSQEDYLQDITGQTEDYQAELNANYNTFIVDDLDFSSYPPLISEFGDLVFTVPYETILYKRVGSTIIQEPLLLSFDENNRRQVLLLGENIWRWRAQSFLNTDSFQDFDNFIGKLVQYLSTDRQRRRLTVNYESFYNGNNAIKFAAQFFNRNYEFDNKGSLEIDLENTTTNETRIYPLIIKQNIYEVDLSGLPPGNYNFTVRANTNEATQSGAFTILDYNVEQQFLNADANKLQQIANQSQGTSYFINDTANLSTDLTQDSRYSIIQKSTKNVVPLIDFKVLLALIALTLATEWFIRKYNGLI